MKQQILNLKKKLLIVELPEYVTEFTMGGKSTMVWDNGIKTKICFGKLTDITESQFEQWVEAYTSLENRFRNYTTPAYIEFLMKTAQESFFSYLKSQEILFSNPLADYEGQMKDFRKQFEEAESKVWQLSQTYLFEILK